MLKSRRFPRAPAKRDESNIQGVNFHRSLLHFCSGKKQAVIYDRRWNDDAKSSFIYIEGGRGNIEALQHTGVKSEFTAQRGKSWRAQNSKALTTEWKRKDNKTKTWSDNNCALSGYQSRLEWKALVALPLLNGPCVSAFIESILIQRRTRTSSTFQTPKETAGKENPAQPHSHRLRSQRQSEWWIKGFSGCRACRPSQERKNREGKGARRGEKTQPSEASSPFWSEAHLFCSVTSHFSSVATRWAPVIIYSRSPRNGFLETNHQGLWGPIFCPLQIFIFHLEHLSRAALDNCLKKKKQAPRKQHI